MSRNNVDHKAVLKKDRLDFENVSVGVKGIQIVEKGSSFEGRKRYLCYFLHRFLSFRLAEVQSVAERVYGSQVGPDGLPVVVWEKPVGGLVASSFWYVHLPDEKLARDLICNCFLIKSIIEIWSEGPSLEKLQEELKSVDAAIFAPYCGKEQSFKFAVDGWGVSIPNETKLEIIQSFGSWLPFEGPIKLENPKNTFIIIMADPTLHSILPPIQKWCFFGREVAENSFRSPLLAKYDLKKRRYLGPTSMDTELSFLMCNLCRVQKSNLVADPFVGTGSLLIAAEAMGALSFGMDIDIRVIKLGKKDKNSNHINVWTNFQDYGLPPPVGIVRGDIHRGPLRSNLEDIFDAVIADPPYGIRAGGRKSKSAPDTLIRDRTTHFAATDPYPLGECLRDLLDWSAKMLVVGGRLAYWMPNLPDTPEDEDIPGHPSLQLKYNCEQVLGGRYNRRLIVMEKISSYDRAIVQSYFIQNPIKQMAIDDLHDVVYATIDKKDKRRTPQFRTKRI